MGRISILDKPVKMIMENNVVSDIVYTSDKVNEKMNVVSTKLKELEDPRDFFIVILEPENNKIKGMLIFGDLDSLFEQLNKDRNLTFEKLSNIKPLSFGYKQPIRDILNAFENNKEQNIILIKNDDENYMGKVRRSNIVKRGARRNRHR